MCSSCRIYGHSNYCSKELLGYRYCIHQDTDGATAITGAAPPWCDRLGVEEHLGSDFDKDTRQEFFLGCEGPGS